jgi:hypothetical protein
MVHYIFAVVATTALAEDIAAQGGSHHMAPLGDDLTIVAFDEEQLETLSGGPLESCAAGFDCFSARLQNRLARASGDGDLIYLETQYSGGSGAQGAALFRTGAQIWCEHELSTKPITRNSPINRALRELGIVASTKLDEFDTVGLSRFRTLSDFAGSIASQT